MAGPHREAEGTKISQWLWLCEQEISMTWLMTRTWLIAKAVEYFWNSIVSSIKWKYQVLHPTRAGLWNNILGTIQWVENSQYFLSCLSHPSHYYLQNISYLIVTIVTPPLWRSHHYSLFIFFMLETECIEALGHLQMAPLSMVEWGLSLDHPNHEVTLLHVSS